MWMVQRAGEGKQVTDVYGESMSTLKVANP